MKSFQMLTIAIIAFLIFGCGKESAGIGSVSTSSAASPSDVLRAFVEASGKKDTAAVKQTMSKGSLELLDKVAQSQNTTADELLARGNSDMIEGNPEISNEKIENDTATVDVKVKTTGSDTIPFVKEDGAWKIAFDKYQQTLVDRMRREMKTPEANSSSANAANTNAVNANAKNANAKSSNAKPAANK